MGTRLMGAGRIITVESVPERIEMSKRLGADIVLDFQNAVSEIMALTDNRGVDVAVEALVKADARRREASERIAEDGLVVPGKRGAPAPHPPLRVERDAARRVARLPVKFGMSPSSRWRVVAVTMSPAGPVTEFMEGSDGRG